jgi:regulator of protease activity HflC (stomatin/prohibitin superfamily)
MTTITWQVEQMSCLPQEEGQTDVVISVAWRVNGELTQDGTTYYTSVYGSQTLAPYTPKSPFTPYADLTLEQVVGWVQDMMGSEQVAAINANIEQQIENQVNPPIVTPPLPWSN